MIGVKVDHAPIWHWFLNLIHFADAKMKKRTKEVGTSWMMDDIQ
ncbi:hypothetical protein [Flavobacterium sp. SLB02]|jgi:transposase-like protein|nr:hypothetical protein [Flavobacterium sp. SLB02]